MASTAGPHVWGMPHTRFFWGGGGWHEAKPRGPLLGGRGAFANHSQEGDNFCVPICQLCLKIRERDVTVFFIRGTQTTPQETREATAKSESEP